MKEVKEVIAYIKRDFQLEWKNKSVLSTSIIYLIAVVFISMHAFESLDPDVWNALFWMVMMFTLLTVVGRSFDNESENKFIYHYHTIKPQTIIAAKLILNVVYSIGLGCLAYIIFSLFLGNQIQEVSTMLIVLILGCMGIGLTFTLTSAISSRAGGNLVLASVLSIPVLLPLIIVLVNLTSRAFGSYSLLQNLNLYIGLFLLNLIVGIISYLLFPYLWQD